MCVLSHCASNVEVSCYSCYSDLLIFTVWFSFFILLYFCLSETYILCTVCCANISLFMNAHQIISKIVMIVIVCVHEILCMRHCQMVMQCWVLIPFQVTSTVGYTEEEATGDACKCTFRPNRCC